MIPGYQIEAVPESLIRKSGLQAPTKKRIDPWNLLHLPQTMTPFPFQREDICYMVEPGGWGAWLDAGCGKTFEALGAYIILKRTGQVDGMLVIGPEAGRHVWCKSNDPAYKSKAEEFIGEGGHYVEKKTPLPKSGIIYSTGDKIFRSPYFEQINELLKSKRWILCVDECFPYETPVITDQGVLPIGQIVDSKLQVRVLSKNQQTNALEWKSVVRWLNRGRKTELCRVTHENGSFVCTPKHKVWTESGYINACNLLNQDLLMVQDRIQLPTGRSKIQGKKVLLGHLPFEKHREQAGKQTEDSRRRALYSGSTNADEQSYEEPRYSSKDGCQLKRAPISNQTWREREVNEYSTNNALAYYPGTGGRAVCHNNETGSRSAAYSQPLQTRLSLSSYSTCNRSGRLLTQHPSCQGEGPEKRFSTQKSRVVCVEIFESNDPSGVGVYDLEVEDNHNYFANDVLVSNCHLFSGYFSKRFNILDLWAEWCRWRWLMSATSQSNYPDTTYPIYKLITRTEVTLEEWNGWFKKSDGGWKENRLAMYGRYQRRFSSTRRKRLPDGTPNPEIAPHLPPVTSTVIRVPLENRQWELYDQVLREGRAVFAERSINAQEFWHKLVHLHSIASHPLVSGETNFGQISKFRILEQLLQSVGNQKVCIWSWHPAVLEWLCVELRERSVLYHGVVSKRDKEQAVYRFNNDPSVRYFLGNPSAAGVSLNLQAGSVRIFWDQHPEWHELHQARERIDRIDNYSGVPLTEYVLLGQGTVEEVTYEANERKQNLQRLVLGQNKEDVWSSPVVGNIFERWKVSK